MENSNNILSIIINGELSELNKMHGFVDQCGEKFNIDKKVLFDIELALDESVTNTISHGFEENKASGQVELMLEEKKDRYIITISDNAPRYNQSIITQPDLSDDIMKRSTGGLGIYLMHNVMDLVHYRYKDNRNVLTLEKFKEQ